MSNDANKSNRTKFALLLLVFAVPVIVSYLAYYVWQPAGGVRNYGELIKGAALAEPLKLNTLDGKAVTSLRGQWWLVMVAPGQCDAACEKKLHALRQVRLTQGREMNRVSRLWVVSDTAAPPAELLQRYEGTLVVRDADKTVVSKLPAQADVREHLYIIDTLGNVVLRYGADPDIVRMKKDLEILLRASQIG